MELVLGVQRADRLVADSMIHKNESKRMRERKGDGKKKKKRESELEGEAQQEECWSEC